MTVHDESSFFISIYRKKSSCELFPDGGSLNRLYVCTSCFGKKHRYAGF